jgi:hypothetical protein
MALLHPVGPLPAATYWRRRLVLLLGVVVLVLLVRALLPGGGGGNPTRSSATPSPSPTQTRAATARPTATASTGTCRDSALTLTVAPEAGQHVAGRPVRFTVTVTNTSHATCRRDLGGRVLEVLIKSGSDRIWSSDDCSTDHTSSLQPLRPGASLQTTVTWQGHRSSPGCPSAAPDARAGTYTVRARLATLRSAAAVLRLAKA